MTYIHNENGTGWKESIIVATATKGGYESPKGNGMPIREYLLDPLFWKALTAHFPHPTCHPEWNLLAQYFFNHVLSKGWDVAITTLHDEVTNHTCTLCPNQSKNDNTALQ